MFQVNSFGARQSECRCKLFTRKMDHFRNATTSLMERYKSVSTTRFIMLTTWLFNVFLECFLIIKSYRYNLMKWILKSCLELFIPIHYPLSGNFYQGRPFIFGMFLGNYWRFLLKRSPCSCAFQEVWLSSQSV